eukprot:GFUD01023597.1.p1 GENE.GFUD01023597.1~~GFUD01023597.1.p1  ORF type:complete len:393 (+),score=96.91 GFUD01023597.1:63-1241(+)
MGSDQSKQMKSSLPNSCEVEQSFEAEEDPRKIFSMNKLSEIEAESKHFREKFKLLDSRVEDLKLENSSLREKVAALEVKVEIFEKSIKSSDSQAQARFPFVPIAPFQQTPTQGGGYLNPFSSTKTSDGWKITTPFTEGLNEKVIKEPTTVAAVHKPEVSLKKISPCGTKDQPHNLSINHYDHPLPTELVNLCKVDHCGLCQLKLNSQIMASEHYWGKKHFEVVEEYLANCYRETPELKPNYKPSHTYNRPLPQAVISQCSSKKCGLCNKTFTPTADQSAVKEHYYGHQHQKNVSKFIQKNPQHWKEGVMPASLKSLPKNISCPRLRDVPSSKDASFSWFPDFIRSQSEGIIDQLKQDRCKFCSVSLASESVAKNHYNGKRHLENVQKKIAKK